MSAVVAARLLEDEDREDRLDQARRAALGVVRMVGLMDVAFVPTASRRVAAGRTRQPNAVSFLHLGSVLTGRHGMSDKDERPNAPEPETMIEKPRKVFEQERDDDIQPGGQRPDVNPSTSVQPGHRDREQIRGS